MSEQVYVVYQRCIAIYDSGRQICCTGLHWSRLSVPAHRSIMSQIGMMPHPVTLLLTPGQSVLLDLAL